MEPDICLPLQQTPQFANALRQTGCHIREIHLPGAAPVQAMTRFGLTFATRGPVWRRTPRKQDGAALRAAGVHIINSDGLDVDMLRAAGFRQTHTGSHVAELYLHTNPDTQLKSMKQKWRNTLRRALRSPLRVQIEHFKPRRHDWLLHADSAQQRHKRYRSLPHDLLYAFHNVKPRDMPVLVAYDRTDPVAAMLFLRHGNSATYHLGWSNPEGRKNAAHHAILHAASNHFAAQGVRRLDLGGVDTVNTPGLARFKIGTGAHIRPLGGTWLRMPRFGL